MTQQQTKSEDWVRGYCDGLATASKVVSILSRSPSSEVAQVLLVMIEALKVDQ